MAKKTTDSVSPESIVRDVRAGKIAPVYYLMGEESYYIDHVADFLLDTLLAPEQRDFNLITLFGAETDMLTVVQAAMGFPMGAERMVVLVKEAQNLKDTAPLEAYLKQPQPSTVLIFCHKNGVIDRRKGLAKLLEKHAVLMESEKVRDYRLPAWVNQYVARKKARIEPQASEILAEYVGADLNRMSGEIDKLLLSAKLSTITVGLVHEHIGVSKEFNIFELLDALGKKDVVKVTRIANYFDKNQKKNPIQMVLPALFRFFSQLMLSYYAPSPKGKQEIATWVGVSEWQVERNILPAMRQYSARKVMSILTMIRRTDAKSKGVDNPATESGDLMKELLFFILH